MCHCITRLKNAVPLPFLFSAWTGSSASGSQSHQPAGWLSAACRGKGGSTLPNFPKKVQQTGAPRGLFPEVPFQRTAGNCCPFPLSHDQGCLRFMSHLYSFITYLAGKKRAPGLPSPPVHSASGSVCVLSTHILLALPAGLRLVLVCLLTTCDFWLSRSTHGIMPE